MITSDSFFVQKVFIKKYSSRIEYFLSLIGESKSTLHIGCADWPIYNPSNNLHILLCDKNPNVDGYDIQSDIIENMKKHEKLVNRNLFGSIPNKKYDVVLAPETIEHVSNVECFLMDIVKCSNPTTEILITAPNAFCNNHISRNTNTGDLFIEIVHPDHNCWYSPYTLPNTIKKVYSSNGIEVIIREIGLLENETMVYVLFSLNTNTLK